jgi:hypothetical protein
LADLNRRRSRADVTAGAVPRACDVCGELAALNRNRPCRLTPGCAGWHVLPDGTAANRGDAPAGDAPLSLDFGGGAP